MLKSPPHLLSALFLLLALIPVLFCMRQYVEYSYASTTIYIPVGISMTVSMDGSYKDIDGLMRKTVKSDPYSLLIRIDGDRDKLDSVRIKEIRFAGVEDNTVTSIQFEEYDIADGNIGRSSYRSFIVRGLSIPHQDYLVKIHIEFTDKGSVVAIPLELRLYKEVRKYYESDPLSWVSSA